MSASTSGVNMMHLTGATDFSVATEPYVGCCMLVEGIGVVEIGVVDMD